MKRVLIIVAVYAIYYREVAKAFVNKAKSVLLKLWKWLLCEKEPSTEVSEVANKIPNEVSVDDLMRLIDYMMFRHYNVVGDVCCG
jgi:hypothetical protein